MIGQKRGLKSDTIPTQIMLQGKTRTVLQTDAFLKVTASEKCVKTYPMSKIIKTYIKCIGTIGLT